MPYQGLIHGAALRMQVGGRQMARAQLKHLLSESERDTVTLLVIPFSAGGFPMAGDSVLYAAASSPHLDTVQVDAPTGAVFIDAPAQLAKFRRRNRPPHRNPRLQAPGHALGHREPEGMGGVRGCPGAGLLRANP